MTSFREKPFRFVGAAPPRHAKTESAAIHFIPWALWQWPELLNTYVTYAATVATEKSVQARTIAERIGVAIGTPNRQDVWKTTAGGGLRAVGVGGALTGRGSDIIIVDDPIANSTEAESAYQREQLWNWWQSTLFNRREPNASVVVFHTRWHEDDLGGRLIRQGWEYVNLPAITSAGEALWPGRWPLEQLYDVRDQVGEYYWAAQYMGDPHPRGARVFRDVVFYDRLPERYRAAIGVDLAYTDDTKNDSSVGLVLLKDLAPGGKFYLVEREKQHVEAPTFKLTLRAQRGRYPGAPLRWYCSGTEKGAASFIKAEPSGVPIQAVTTTSDKFTRAQPVAAAWNRGDVLSPRNAPWLADFLRVLHGFTGVKDKEDDDIDALAAAFDLLNRPAPTHDGNWEDAPKRRM